MTKVFRRVKAFFPSKLPQGMTEFDTWSDSIIELSGLPNNDSMKFALAVAVLHLNSTDAYKAKEFFIRTLIKGAASQIAGGVMQDLKNKQLELAAKEQAEAQAKEQQKVEATTPTQEAASNVPQTTQS